MRTAPLCAARGPRAARRLGGVLAGLLALLLPASGARAMSAPGMALLAAAEGAPVVVVGRVTGVVRLDGSGFVASVKVRRALRGSTPGEDLAVAWEELAPGRAPRLAERQTVLLALEDLPTSSLWQARASTRPGLRLIAAGGDALLIDPSVADAKLLAVYLSMPDEAAAARAGALVRLASDASEPLAVAAVARLGTPALATALRPQATTALLRVAGDARRPLALRRAIVAFAGDARLAEAAPALERLGGRAGALQAPALQALGQIRGGLPPEQVEALLERPEAALRAVGARYASGALAEQRLRTMVRDDSAPEVRAAAAQALAATRTVWGVDACLPALADANPAVRAAAAEALGRLGVPAVAALERTARQVPAQAPGAVTALSLAGQPGIAALRRLAADAPSEPVRDLARLALGEGPHAH